VTTATPEPDPRAAAGYPGGLDEQVSIGTASQMQCLGRRLAGLLSAGDLVVLSGPLGAGKTTLAQGIGAGLGVRGQVTSPTFVIARVHPSLRSGPDLVHADAYRLGSRAEVDDLDLDADLGTAVTVVEWGEGLVEMLAESFLTVTIQAQVAGLVTESPADHGADGPRTVRVQGFGPRWKDAEVHAAVRTAVTGSQQSSPAQPGREGVGPASGSRTGGGESR
jgi:tRNA threonylcarbamoyladenosine biosynthesis protein TsaE